MSTYLPIVFMCCLFTACWCVVHMLCVTMFACSRHTYMDIHACMRAHMQFFFFSGAHDGVSSGSECRKSLRNGHTYRSLKGFPQTLVSSIGTSFSVLSVCVCVCVSVSLCLSLGLLILFSLHGLTRSCCLFCVRGGLDCFARIALLVVVFGLLCVYACVVCVYV